MSKFVHKEVYPQLKRTMHQKRTNTSKLIYHFFRWHSFVLILAFFCICIRVRVFSFSIFGKFPLPCKKESRRNTIVYMTNVGWETKHKLIFHFLSLFCPLFPWSRTFFFRIHLCLTKKWNEKNGTKSYICESQSWLTLSGRTQTHKELRERKRRERNYS